MRKATYVSDEKAIYRQKLLEFIDSTIPARFMRYARVLCFPGHEALEIYDVYDKLGIKRENIVALEDDSDSYKILDSKKLGIKLIPNKAVDFAVSDEKIDPFHIINLDFCGRVSTPENYITIKALVKRKLISEYLDAVFATNSFAGRDGWYSNDMKVLTLSINSYKTITSLLSKKVYEPFNLEIKGNRLGRKDSIFYVRDVGLTYEILNLLFTPSDRLIEFFKAAPFHETVIRFIRDESENPDQFTDDALMEDPLYYMASLNNFLGVAELMPKQHVDRPEDILKYHFLSTAKSYLPKKLERYAYRNENNKTMLCDFIQVYSFHGLPSNLSKHFKIDWENGIPNIELGKHYRLFRKIQNRIYEIMDEVRDSIKFEIPPRVYLGDGSTDYGSIDEIVREVSETQEHQANLRANFDEEKQAIYKLIEQGKSNEEIMQLFPKTKKFELAGYRAWCKRRKN